MLVMLPGIVALVRMFLYSNAELLMLVTDGESSPAEDDPALHRI